MKRYLNLRMLLALWVLTAVAACSNFGLAPATTPAQGIAYAYGQVAAIRQQAATGVTTGTVSVATAQNVLTQTDKARAALDVAQATVATGGDLTTAASQLAVANAIILQLQSLLPPAKPL